MQTLNFLKHNFPTANPYIEAFIFGLSYGLVFCTSTCLPYIASYIAGIGAGFRKGVTVTVIFNSGRVIAYALIGAAIGAFKLLLSDETLAAFQTYSSFAFAAVTVAIGASLLIKSRQSTAPCKDCNVKQQDNSLRRVNEKFDFRAFSLGLSSIGIGWPGTQPPVVRRLTASS